MITKLFTSAAVWTGLGLASGLFYREFTRQTDFTGVTQLSVAHTHALALGTTILLVVLALAKSFPGLADDRRAGLFLGLWNAGLALTFTMMLVKGSLQVLGAPLATSPMLAGISGLGHMILTGAFALFFVLLRRGIKADAAAATGERVGSAA